jgi:hypothetical protein
MLNGQRLNAPFGIRHSAFSIDTVHHPQQSVLKRQFGHRQTACIRNISAPQRSQRTLSTSPLDVARDDPEPVEGSQLLLPFAG